jgi:hypothetical protein
VQLELHHSPRKLFPAAAPEPARSVLLLPGLNNSGPHHWQSHWERLPHFSRVDFGNWTEPKLHEWIARLDRAVRESPRPLVLAAHSLGCLAAVWWAALSWSEAFSEKVVGALLVAPPDVDSENIEFRLRDFRPLPRVRLPFPSILVASRNDPYCRYETAQDLARSWGSEIVDAGAVGHINSASALGEWSCGLRLLAGISGHNANLLIAELGLRTQMAD